MTTGKMSNPMKARRRTNSGAWDTESGKGDLDPDMTLFSLWFIPQGVTGHVSFPSGHTVLGWMVLPVVLLFESRPRIRKWVAVGAIVWAFCVAIGRVRAGAHYASDVTFSSGVTIMFFACAERLYRHRASEP